MSAFQTYWRSYGGWKALVLSPYLLLSGIFWGFCTPIWRDRFDDQKNIFEWVEWSFSILPSMVSFSLGGLAIFLAFSNKSFLKIIRQGGDEQSYLMAVTAAFFHFILIQFIALAFTFLTVSFPVVWVSGISFWIFLYAMSCGIAAAAALMDVAEILNAIGKIDD